MSAADRLPAALWQQIFSIAALADRPSSLVDTWIAGRQVCKTWRAQIAQTYLDTFIGKPSRCYIAFDFGTDYYEELGKCHLGLELVFDRLDPDDKSRCVFKESEDTSGKWVESLGKAALAEYREAKYGTWGEQLELYMNEDLAKPEWDEDSEESDDSDADDESSQDRETHSPNESDDSTSDEEPNEWGDNKLGPIVFEFPAHVLHIWGIANDTELPALKADIQNAEISFNWEGMLTEFLKERAEIDR